MNTWTELGSGLTYGAASNGNRMITSLQKSLREGLSLATRLYAPLVIVFVVTTAAALVLTLPTVAAFNGWLGRRLALGDLARDFNALLPIETMLSSNARLQAGAEFGAPIQGASTAEAQSAALVYAVMTGTLLAAGPLGALVYIALSGGVLLVYADGRFAWRRFAWGAWHWALPFLVLWLVATVCQSFVIMLGLSAWFGLGAARLEALAWVLTALAVWVYLLLAAWFEYARAIAVSAGRRNVFWALARAAGFLVRRPVPALGVYTLVAALGWVLSLLYAGVIAPVIPFAWGVVGIALQQLVVVGRLWTRLARWASELVLYRQQDGQA